MDGNYDVITLTLKHLSFEIATMFIKTTFKDSKKSKESKIKY